MVQMSGPGLVPGVDKKHRAGSVGWVSPTGSFFFFFLPSLTLYMLDPAPALITQGLSHTMPAPEPVLHAVPFLDWLEWVPQVLDLTFWGCGKCMVVLN